MTDRTIFQLGTNNWQRGGEFAPGSGILHESHHRAYNAIDGVAVYSLYPSRVQRFEADDVRVFELEHDIPICESVSPVSSYRWHSMSDAEFAGYRQRLTTEVTEWMAEIEQRTGRTFDLAIAHHTFLNPVVMRDVIAARVADGLPSMPLVCFAHGTALKMYINERKGADDFPARFGPFMEAEGVFDIDNPAGHVDAVAAISGDQVEAFLDVFPDYPADRVVLSLNGYNQDVFTEPTPTTPRFESLAGLSTLNGGTVPDDLEHVVVFCGKFADWKRIDALLVAAAEYEAADPSISTIIVGGGPDADRDQLLALAYDELGLQRTYFVGPKGQAELAAMFGAADVGCFPSRNEPFGLVFVEAMACGTPVIGANSGGPKDFVTDEVGVLVAESEDRAELAERLAAAVLSAIRDDWKATKGPRAAAYAADGFGVPRQVTDLLAAVDRITANT